MPGAGVVCGNEAVWTVEPDGPPALLGMDFVRSVDQCCVQSWRVCIAIWYPSTQMGPALCCPTPQALPALLLTRRACRLALERAATAAEGVEVIASLLEKHGQGGGCEEGGEQAQRGSHGSGCSPSEGAASARHARPSCTALLCNLRLTCLPPSLVKVRGPTTTLSCLPTLPRLGWWRRLASAGPPSASPQVASGHGGVGARHGAGAGMQQQRCLWRWRTCARVEGPTSSPCTVWPCPGTCATRTRPSACPLAGVHNISNCLSIRSDFDRCSPGLQEHARSQGLWDGAGALDWAAAFSDGGAPPLGKLTAGREANGRRSAGGEGQRGAGSFWCGLSLPAQHWHFTAVCTRHAGITWLNLSTAGCLLRPRLPLQPPCAPLPQAAGKGCSKRHAGPC